MEYTLFFAHDPGAAELISHYYKKEKRDRNVVLVGKGFAKSVFQRIGLPFVEVRTTDALLEYFERHRKEIDRVVSGTSQSDDCDYQLWKKARECNIRMTVHVDHWMNLIERFSHHGEMFIPDSIYVVDHSSKDALVKEGIPASVISVVGHPILEMKAQSILRLKNDEDKLRSIRNQLNVGESTPVYVFISENITELGFKNELGFDELDSFKAFRAAVHLTGVIVKLHPKETMQKWTDFLYNSKIRDCVLIYDELNPEDLLAVADRVGGIYSILLLQAHLAGIPTTSYQPNLKCKNHLEGSFVEGITTVIQPIQQ